MIRIGVTSYLNILTKIFTFLTKVAILFDLLRLGFRSTVQLLDVWITDEAQFLPKSEAHFQTRVVPAHGHW